MAENPHPDASLLGLPFERLDKIIRHIDTKGGVLKLRLLSRGLDKYIAKQAFETMDRVFLPDGMQNLLNFAQSPQASVVQRLIFKIPNVANLYIRTPECDDDPFDLGLPGVEMWRADSKAYSTVARAIRLFTNLKDVEFHLTPRIWHNDYSSPSSLYESTLSQPLRNSIQRTVVNTAAVAPQANTTMVIESRERMDFARDDRIRFTHIGFNTTILNSKPEEDGTIYCSERWDGWKLTKYLHAGKSNEHHIHDVLNPGRTHNLNLRTLELRDVDCFPTNLERVLSLSVDSLECLHLENVTIPELSWSKIFKAVGGCRNLRTVHISLLKYGTKLTNLLPRASFEEIEGASDKRYLIFPGRKCESDLFELRNMLLTLQERAKSTGNTFNYNAACRIIMEDTSL